MLAQVLLIDAQHIGRCRGVGFHVIVEGEAVHVAEIARLVDAQDHGFDEAVEPPEHVLRRHFAEIPRADRVLDRFEHRVLADALRAAEHERVVDLLLRPLHAVGQPQDHVLGLLAVDLADVLQPRPGLAGIAWLDLRRPVEVETAHAAALDPAARRDEAVADDHRQARCPRHLLDRLVLIQPSAGGLITCSPSSSSTGLPSRRHSGTGGMRALTLAAGHSSRDGV